MTAINLVATNNAEIWKQTVAVSYTHFFDTAINSHFFP